VTAPGVEYWSGQRYGWRYLAQQMNGLGTPGAWLSNELPLLDVAFTDVLSGPPQLTASINPVFTELFYPDGKPLLVPWRCAIYAEQDGVIRGGGLLVSDPAEGPQLNIDCSGFSGYLKGMPYESQDPQEFVEADPLDIGRFIWDHVQSGEESNLGMIVDDTTNTGGVVRLGHALVPDAEGNLPANPSPDEGPYRLARYSHADLGKTFDDLAGSTPFEYHERHEWNQDKTEVRHYLDFGYPRLGRRQDELRFVLGENIQTLPTLEDDGSDWASHVRVMGAGEGSAMVIGEARVATGGLRRVATIDRKELTDQTQADAVARRALLSRLKLGTVSSVVVRNTPGAPLGAWGVGDEIRVQAEEEWREVDLWVRVIGISVRPNDPESISMDLLRSDLVA
jgi:hypothetical protein